MDPRKTWCWIAVFAAIGVIGAVYVLTQGMQSPPRGLERFATGALSKLEVRDETPPLSSRELQVWGDEPQTLQSLKGRVLLVNLWATWCAPCVEEMPSLDALQARYGEAGFQIVPVSLDRDLAEAATFYEEFGLQHLPLWGDNTLAIGNDIDASGVPTSVVYNHRGEEVARLSAEADWNSPEAHRLIEAMLAEKEALSP